MTPSLQDTSPQSFTPSRRWKIGLNVAASILVLLAILGMLNYLAARHSRRLQWSADARFHLSPVTKEVLRATTNQVKVVLFFDRTRPLYDMVADLIREYKAQSSRLEVEYVDYERSPGRAKVIQGELGLAPAAEGDRVVFASGGQKRVVYAKDLSEFDYGALLKGQEVRRTGFKGEQLFTSAIFSLTDTRPVRVYFLQGHKEHDPADQDNQMGYLNFARMLQESQITVVKMGPTDLLNGDVPSDCQLLVIANPSTPLAEPELDGVAKYLNSGGRLMVLFNANSLQKGTGLEKMLADWGVEVGRNVVYEAPQAKVGDAETVVVSHFGNHPIVNPLTRSRLLLIWPRSIAARAKSPQGADAPKATELAMTSPDGMASRPNGTVEVQGAAIPLIVAVEKGAIQGIATDRGTARIIVAGDSYFLGNKLIEYEANRDFARNAVNWLLNRDALVQGIGSKTLKEYRITMTASELTRVRWLFLAGFPGGVLFMGFLVWFRRRA